MEAIFLTNRIIRNYLQLFNENKWKDVIKYTLIYGIQSLQCHYNLTQLSTQKLEEIIRHSNYILTAEDFDNVELNRLRALKSNADYLSNEMGIDPKYSSFPIFISIFILFYLYLFIVYLFFTLLFQRANVL
jgi:hypothetical protein